MSLDEVFNPQGVHPLSVVLKRWGGKSHPAKGNPDQTTAKRGCTFAAGAGVQPDLLYGKGIAAAILLRERKSGTAAGHCGLLSMQERLFSLQFHPAKQRGQ
jgi:hypothetical protein